MDETVATITHYGFLSVLPTLVAIVLALTTKRVIASLLAGILIAAFIIDANTTGFVHALVYAIPNLFSTISGHASTETLKGFGMVKNSSRGELLISITILCAFMSLLNRSGGALHFAENVSKKIKKEQGALLIAMLIGLSIFTSAYFSILVTAAVMIPVFDRMKISREKLAFYADAMSAPTKALFPFSGWIPFMAVLIEENIPSVGAGNGLRGFVDTVPYNFYCIGIIVFVFLLSMKWIPDFGPMKRAEKRVKVDGIITEPGSKPMMGATDESDLEKEAGNGTFLDFFMPVFASVLVLFVLSIWDSYIINWFGVPKIGINSMQIMNVAFAVAIIVAFLMYMPRKVMKPGEFLDALVKGATSSVTGSIIIILAITLGDTMKAPVPEGLGTANFLVEILKPLIVSFLIPAITFIMCAMMSFAMGTSWGTWAIMMPVSMPLALSAGVDPYLTAAAVLGGGAFGDHCGPISDTTVLSSIASKLDHSQHLSTQIPYAVTVAGFCVVMYALFGLIV